MKEESILIDEVRQRAFKISEKFGHDLKAYARHLKEIEEANRSRVVSQITVVAPKPSTEK